MDSSADALACRLGSFATLLVSMWSMNSDRSCARKWIWAWDDGLEFGVDLGPDFCVVLMEFSSASVSCRFSSVSALA